MAQIKRKTGTAYAAIGITLKPDVLAELDKHCERMKLTRSTVVASLISLLKDMEATPATLTLKGER